MINRSSSQLTGLLSNSIALSTTKLISIVISVIISIFIAREIGPNGRGAYGIILTSCLLLPTFLNLGLNIGVHFLSHVGNCL